MQYREHENIIFRGDKYPGFSRVFMSEKLVGGKWVPAGKAGIDANVYGQVMTEQEAREFQGEGWPAEDSAEESAEEPTAE